MPASRTPTPCPGWTFSNRNVTGWYVDATAWIGLAPSMNNDDAPNSAGSVASPFDETE